MKGTVAMTTQIINPGWLLEVVKHAGNETPEAFDVIIHKRNAFEIEFDFSNNPMLQYLKKTGTTESSGLPDYFNSLSHLQAYRWQLYSITTKLFNLAYFNGLYLCYQQRRSLPMADLYTVLLDNRRGEPAAKALLEVITNFCHEWRSRTEQARDENSALKIFDEILVDPFPEEITAWAAFCCCWRDFTKTDQVQGLPSEILYRIGNRIKKIMEQSTDAERNAFDKLIESLSKRKLKTGKTVDNTGYKGVIRDLEKSGKRITKISRGRKVFDAEKIFKTLKPYTRENPYQFEEYYIFIGDKRNIKTNLIEPAIFQNTPGSQERSLTINTFQNLLSKMSL